MRVTILILFLPFTILLAGCGGGGGGNDGSDIDVTPNAEIFFTGTLQATTVTGALKPSIGATVCALNNCGQTTTAGTWGFSVPQSLYSGGTVTFVINGPDLPSETQANVNDLNSSSRQIDVNFVITEEGDIKIQSVAQDGVPVTNDENNSEEDEPLSSDPSERACEVLKRTNITINNVSTPIVHQASESCPEHIKTILAVGNIHRIGFEYEILTDVPDLEISPKTGVAEQGQLNKHDGSYLCTKTESFVVNVTARVIRYFLPGGETLTSADAIALCGSRANVGNTEETKQITVQIEPAA